MTEAFVTRITHETGLPGFTLITAYDDGDSLVGFAYGYTQERDQWWPDADQPAPTSVAEANRFAVVEWAVLPSHRGKGIGRLLIDHLLSDRGEPYATLTVNPLADASAIYQRWGWLPVASTTPGKLPAMNVMVLDLRLSSKTP